MLEKNIDPLSANPTKWSNTLKQFVGKRVFDHFMGLTFKGLIKSFASQFANCVKQSPDHIAKFLQKIKGIILN